MGNGVPFFLLIGTPQHRVPREFPEEDKAHIMQEKVGDDPSLS